jgi:hypothetical protein
MPNSLWFSPQKLWTREKQDKKMRNIYKKKLSLFIITTKSHHNGLTHHQPAAGKAQVGHDARKRHQDEGLKVYR